MLNQINWRETGLPLAGLALAFGMIGGGYLLGDGLRRSKTAERSVTVRGVAERDVTANLATWTLNLSAEGSDQGSVQDKIERDSKTVIGFLRGAGFPETAISDAGGGISSVYDKDREAMITSINRRITLRTGDVMRAQRTYARQFDLIRQGVFLSEGSGMQYVFTGLNAIKPQMIANATKDARRGAERFAENSGASVGQIRSASQGYFSVSARDGDATSEEGSGGGESPLQKVRVVTTIDYYLR